MTYFTSARAVGATGRECLERWMVQHRELFRDKTVLDFGCGKQPYRSLIKEMGGSYYGYDHPNFPDAQVVDVIDERPLGQQSHFDVIICNQVLSLVPDPNTLLREFRSMCDTLVLTVDQGYRQFMPERDLWRWTESGLRMDLEDAGFFAQIHSEVFTVKLAPDYEVVMIRGVVAR